MENKEFEEMSKKEERIVIATIIVEIALALITLLTIFLPAVVLALALYLQVEPLALPPLGQL